MAGSAKYKRIRGLSDETRQKRSDGCQNTVLCCWNLARGNWLTCHRDEDEREPLSESQFFFFHAFFKTVIAACCGRTGRFLSLAMKSEWKGKIQFFTILGLFTLPLLAKYFLLFRNELDPSLTTIAMALAPTVSVRELQRWVSSGQSLVLFSMISHHELMYC